MAKRFLIIPNLKKSGCLDAVKKVTSYLTAKNCSVYCLKERSEQLLALNVSIIEDKDFDKIEAAIIFGGDGTFLESARRLKYDKIPLIGINLGHLGYLSEVEPSELIDSLDKLIEDKYTIEKRITLEISDGENRKFLGFNEMVIHRGCLSHIVEIAVDINGQHIEKVRADGLLIATPTGSTAYNLSSGGPIILPSAKSLVITPICAHSLAVKPIVVGNEDIIRISVTNIRNDGYPVLIVDGQSVGDINEKTSLFIKVSDVSIPLIKTKENSFYQTLQKKFNSTEIQ